MNEITCRKRFQRDTWHIVCARHTAVITSVWIDLRTVCYGSPEKGYLIQPGGEGWSPGDES